MKMHQKFNIKTYQIYYKYTLCLIYLALYYGLFMKKMGYDYSDVIRKINQLLESNDEFCRRIERSIEEIREEVRDLGNIVRNQAQNTQNENRKIT